MDAKDQPAFFLREMFGTAVSKDAQISIWEMPGRRTQRFDDSDQAARYALELSEGHDVYYGVGLYRPGITTGRGTAKDVVAITHLWADLDFGGLHKKPGIPPDESSAYRIIERIGPPPSLINHSGHGLHGYWFLTEELTVEDGAARLAARWGATIKAAARSLNFTVDSVSDLARVLRVPGTWNRKHDPMPVRIVYPTDGHIVRYDADQLEGWCQVEEFDKGNPRSITNVNLVAAIAEAEPPSSKMSVLLENDRRFKNTWNHNRPDLTDQSASSFDLALASFAVANGWSDQEIANLLIAFRRKHNLQPEKALRRDYLQRTIGKAKQGQESVAAITELELNCTKPEPGKATESTRKEILEKLSKVFGIPIARWIQHGSEKASYAVGLSDGSEIPLGSVNAALSQDAWRRAIYERIHVLPKRVKDREWLLVCNWLGSVVEVVENQESGRLNELREWFGTYLRSTEPTKWDAEDIQNSLDQGGPIVREGQLHIHAGTMLRTIRHEIDDPHTRVAVLWGMLRAAGFEQVQLNHRDGDETLGRSYWRDQKGFCNAIFAQCELAEDGGQ